MLAIAFGCERSHDYLNGQPETTVESDHKLLEAILNKPIHQAPIRFFHQSHNTVHFGGLFTLKQWIISSLKHDTVLRVNKLHCFYVKNPPKRIALWDRENSQSVYSQVKALCSQC